MEIDVTSIEKIPVIEVRGEIDHGTCTALEIAVNEAMVEGHEVVLLDLQKVSYIDSGGLSVLLSTLRRLRERGWLGVIGPNANVLRLLEIVGLTVDDAFRVFKDPGQAIATLKGRNLS